MIVEVIAPDRAEALAGEIEAVRTAAWAPLVGLEAAADRFGWDADDRRSWHFVVREDGMTVAVGRLTPFADVADVPEPISFAPHAGCVRLPAGVAGRLAVRPGRRHRGLAAAIIEERLVLARWLGLVEVWGETRAADADGLARHGYERVAPSGDRSVAGEWVIMRAPLDGRP